MPQPRPFQGGEASIDPTRMRRLAAPARRASLPAAQPSSPTSVQAGAFNQQLGAAVASVQGIGGPLGDDNGTDPNDDNGGAQGSGGDGSVTATDGGSDSSGLPTGIAPDDGGAVALHIPPGAAMPVGLAGLPLAADPDGPAGVLAVNEFPTF